MKILIACEFTGVVREAFTLKGHNAYSCDLLPTLIKSDKHIICDVLQLLDREWDMMIAFPPCTHLAVSGARWFHLKQQEQKDALDFVNHLMNADIPKICIENPVGVISTYVTKPTQIIQPFEHGHPYTKKTCLWLKGLVKLKPSNIVLPSNGSFAHKISGKDVYGKKARSKTFLGVAKAMADQWG